MDADEQRAESICALPFDLQALRTHGHKRIVLSRGVPRIALHVAPPHSRMTPDFAQCYAALGIAPTSDWQRLREHYRLLAKQWHPDHFRADATGAQQAEEKIKEINQAFYTLSQYYRRHGELPAAPAQAWFDHDTRTQTNTASTPPAAETPVRPRTTDDARADRATRTRKWHYAAVGIAALLISGLTLLFKPTPRAQAVTAPAPTSALPSANSTATSQTPAAPAAAYFTIGSTLGEVHAIQGTPTRVDGDTWHYGDAKIWFRHGVVHRWEDDPLTPLKARTDTGPLVRATRFRVGSTMHEVRSIQGKPTHEGENVWDYGVSRVYFKGDRVAGWDNSPLNPLKVR